MSDSDNESARLRARLVAFDEAWSVSLKSDSIHDVRHQIYLLVKQARDQYYATLGLGIKETTNV